MGEEGLPRRSKLLWVLSISSWYMERKVGKAEGHCILPPTPRPRPRQGTVCQALGNQPRVKSQHPPNAVAELSAQPRSGHLGGVMVLLWAREPGSQGQEKGELKGLRKLGSRRDLSAERRNAEQQEAREAGEMVAVKGSGQ